MPDPIEVAVPQSLEARDMVSALRRMAEEAIGHTYDVFIEQQEENLKRYFREPYGDEVDGRSKVVSNDVAEVVDDTLPDLLEPFLSSTQAAEFEAETKEQENYVDAVNSYVNHIFWKDNDGFNILYSGAKDGLISKIGIAKVVWETEEIVENIEYEGLNLAQVFELQDDDELEITEVVERDVFELIGNNPNLAQAAIGYPDGLAYDVGVKRVKKKSKLKVLPVPPEEFRISNRVASIYTAPPYCAHVCMKKRADLVEMGFDPELVSRLPSYSSRQADDRKRVRFKRETRREIADAHTDPMQDDVKLYEEYAYFDDEQGGSRLIKAFRVETVLLETEEVEDNPFVAWSPYPVTHRFYGEAQVDKINQTAKVKTVLTRQLLDGIYHANNPRTEVPQEAEGEHTISDLLNYRIGQVVRTRRPGMLNTITTPDRSGETLQAINYFDNVRMKESGILPGAGQVAADDVDRTLPVSATESRRIDRNALKRTKMMARIFGHSFVYWLWRKMLRTIVKYQDFERMIKVNNDWVMMDPRRWDAELNVAIRVGIGHPNMDQEAVAGATILNLQAQGRELGFVSERHLYNTAKKIIQATGEKFVDDYIINPLTREGQQEIVINRQRMQQEAGPDPKLVAVQQKAQLDQLRLRQNMQIKMEEMRRDQQIEMARIRADMAVDREKANQDFAIDREKIDREFALAIEQLNRETALKERQLDEEIRLAEEKIEAQSEGSTTEIAGSVRFGGAVG